MSAAESALFALAVAFAVILPLLILATVANHSGRLGSALDRLGSWLAFGGSEYLRRPVRCRRCGQDADGEMVTMRIAGGAYVLRHHGPHCHDCALQLLAETPCDRGLLEPFTQKGS